MSARVFDYSVGGNSRYARELYRALGDLGVIAQLLRPGLPGLGRPGVKYLLSEAGWPVRLSPKTFDIVHYPADTGPVVSGRTPIVSTIHGVASRHLAGVRSRSGEWAWRTRVSRSAHSAERIITVSRSSALDISEVFNVDPRKIDVIYHGIDHARFNPDGVMDTETLADRQLPADYILYLGNLDPRKNIVRLVEAFDAARGDLEGTKLVVAGKPAWGADVIKAAIDRAVDVIYLGPAAEAEVAPLMRQARAFIFPSLYEGFGFPVLEAMACGTPVITTDRGSLAEVVGPCATIVDPDDVDSIANGIRQVFANPSAVRSLREAAIGRAAEFTWEASAAAHLEAFRLATQR